MSRIKAFTSCIFPLFNWIKLGGEPRKSMSACRLTAALDLRNTTHGMNAQVHGGGVQFIDCLPQVRHTKFHSAEERYPCDGFLGEVRFDPPNSKFVVKAKVQRSTGLLTPRT